MKRKNTNTVCFFCAVATAALTGCGGSSGSTTITKTPPLTQHDWIWQSGSQNATQPGVYGTQGMPSPLNVPGSRHGFADWADSHGNFWLFGGDGLISPHNSGFLDDLWMYQPSTGQWTWVSGSQQPNQSANFGTIGVASPTNIPAGRISAQTWTDAQGNLWLFSGSNLYSDMWKFTPSTGEWTFMGGGTENNFSGPIKGIYGTLGQPSPTNQPGPRDSAATWTDQQGNLWMYGGDGYDSNGQQGFLGDIWRYSPANLEWTWMGGSPIANTQPSYGSKGVASASNTPGGRGNSAFWGDAQGNLWLFGGGDVNGYNNDLWEYSNGEWTWIAGSNQPSQAGIYGTVAVPSPQNAPGARFNSVMWMDAHGNLWLFGGIDSLDIDYNDLWVFTNGQWAWMSGPQVPTGYGSFGAIGVGSSSDEPPPRTSAGGWVDQSGNLWLFGGVNVDIPQVNWYNDLWEYPL